MMVMMMMMIEEIKREAKENDNNINTIRPICRDTQFVWLYAIICVKFLLFVIYSGLLLYTSYYN